MVVLHANWSEGRLHLWCERSASARTAVGTGTPDHPGCEPSAGCDKLVRRLMSCAQRQTMGEPLDGAGATSGVGASAAGSAATAEPGLETQVTLQHGSLTLRVPLDHRGNVIPSPALRASRAATALDDGDDEPIDDGASPLLNGDDGAGGGAAVSLGSVRVSTVHVSPLEATALLDAVEEACRAEQEREHDRALAHGATDDSEDVLAADSVRYFAAASRLARAVLADQRFVPLLSQEGHSGMAARWQAWLADEKTAAKVAQLVGAMPAGARCAADDNGHDAWAVTEGFISAIVDRWARAALASEAMEEAIEGRDAVGDSQVFWLSGLLGSTDKLEAEAARRASLLRAVRGWIGVLSEGGAVGEWRLCLKLGEPMLSAALRDFERPGDDVEWLLTIHLQCVDDESIVIDAPDIWDLDADSVAVAGRRLDDPQGVLLKEMGRASRLYPKLEEALGESRPESLELGTRAAYEFLREVRPLLLEQGFGVIVPEWWDSPAARLGARLLVDGGEQPGAVESGASNAPTGDPRLGLGALVNYTWQIAVGETTLTLDEFERLAGARTPLVMVGGRWVEIRPEDIKAAVQFIKENPGGTISLGQALRLAYGTDASATGVSVLGLDAKGWVAALLGDVEGEQRMATLTPPEEFHGQLRPYQIRGVSWLAFLDRMGLGACLADDMGLGKTIQLLALLLWERHELAARRPEGSAPTPDGPAIGPTLLVVPMSIVDNWLRETARFAPSLKVVVHHGVTRLTGDTLVRAAENADLVITTYALAHRDRDGLAKVAWWRIVLDEAQNIKNPYTKQTQAIRGFIAPRRIALTGTPLENRLSELWSIIDFCNPGYLGGAGEFRRVFGVPVERHHDREKSAQLRRLVRPFILRRLKTNPQVISDLPEKTETKEFCRLTPEQARLYEQCVKEMLTEIEHAEGIRRRGAVLTALIRLKQICNHPAQLLKEQDAQLERATQSARSGKCIRLIEMLEEVLAEDAQALVFTQFRQMGDLLTGMLRSTLGREALFLHGGTPRAQREAMVDRFQSRDRAAPIFILSLKAGGVGLNLTAATHVFHFDRWWNPAVENQATDRAYRIGQTKAVQVHKFIVAGTLEERIDQMIEGKIALAQDIIGAGEEWLTELSTSQLRELLTLRPDAVADE